MALRRKQLGLGAAAVALVATASIGFVAPPSQQVPTVTVWHSPT